MGSLFSADGSKKSKKKNQGKESPKITDMDRAILNLKVARDDIMKLAKQIDNEAAQLDQQALLLLRAGRRDRVKIVLQIKKYKTKSLHTMDGQLQNVMKMVGTLEQTQTQLVMVRRLKESNALMTELRKEVNLERIEQLMEDTAEAQEVQDEINATMARSDAALLMTDEELEIALEQFRMNGGEAAREEATAPIPAVVLPAVPTHVPVPVLPTQQQDPQEQEAAAPIAV